MGEMKESFPSPMEVLPKSRRSRIVQLLDKGEYDASPCLTDTLPGCLTNKLPT